ncbi:MAG: septal ring lytic transglycosylase RlpA family protein [Chitinophagaceae bacterium]
MLHKKITIVCLLIMLLSASCHRKITSHSKTSPSNYSKSDIGNASYYADKFIGRSTANGEKYSATKFTAAHRTLPFGTMVKVTNLQNGKSVVVRINDRGPFVSGRIIDLSKIAAKQIDVITAGVARVKIEY